jgi:hypothetical protein
MKIDFPVCCGQRHRVIVRPGLVAVVPCDQARRIIAERRAVKAASRAARPGAPPWGSHYHWNGPRRRAVAVWVWGG